jgi:DNA-binding NarL/FixJ family response regulator
MRLFIVDDSPTARRVLRALLAGAPDVAVAAEATSGEEALERVEDVRPDVVVMDWSMPGMSGVEATAELHRRHPDVRVVAFTSTDEERVRRAFLDAGAVAVYAKEQVRALTEYLRDAAAAA